MSGIKELIKGFSPKGIAEGTLSTVLDKGAEIADRFITTGAEKEQFAQQWAKLEMEAETLNQKDRESARLAEIERIKESESWITQNLNSVLALGVIALSFILFGVLALVKVEPTQKDIIIYVLGALTTFVGQIVAYYFGSSKSSNDKTKEISRLVKH